MKKRIITMVLCLAFVFLIGGELILNSFTIKASAETVTSFDETRIEDDLAHMDLSVYPSNSKGDCDIIYATEYCYSVNSQYNSKYGLYIYVYNPTEKTLSTYTELNSVSMATSYDEFSSPETYESLKLEFLDKTDNNRFYKFKLTESEKLLSMAHNYAKLNNGKRRYEFIDLELTQGSDRLESGVSKYYEFSGFAAYCDQNGIPASSLTCYDDSTRTIHLVLDHTNYRFSQNEETYISDELNSVYFAVPESYFEEFGDLTKISAEWYEYKTNYMFVTSDDGAYAALLDMRNIRINEFGQMIDYKGQVLDTTELTRWRVYWEEHEAISSDWGAYYLFSKTYAGKNNNSDIDDDGVFDGSIFNKDDESGIYALSDYWSYVSYLNWLFLVEDVEDADDYRVSREKVEAYMKSYTKKFSKEELILGKYAASLFVDSIDQDRLHLLENPSATSGYIQMEFDISDINEYLDSDKDQSKWNKFWFGEKYKSYKYSPIVTLSDADLDLSDDAFSEKFFVGKEDVSRIKKNAKEDLAHDKVPVLLRFAVTDYYASTARFDYAEEDAFEMSDHDGYVAQETVFLDFDVLSLTFDSGYREHVIGVVAEPIDIINGLTPPSDLKVEETSWFKIIVRLVLLLIAAIVLMPALIPLCKFVVEGVTEGAVAVVKLGFNLVTAPFKIFSSRNRRW